MITPTFSLAFTTATLDPSVAFTRSGATATRVNSSGYIETMGADTPRFDFNPVTLACKGLLIEELRANKCQFSEDVSSWTQFATCPVTANDIISPDGTQNADKLTATTGSDFRATIVAFTGNGEKTISLFIKAATDGQTGIILRDDSAPANRRIVTVTWTSGVPVVASVAGTGTIYPVQSFKDGWYRVSFSAIGVIAANTNRLRVYPSWNNVAAQVYVWGSQGEDATFATSYIPNLSTGATTRNPDVATITGTNFSDFWQAIKGGAMVQAIPSTVSGIRPLVQYDDGTADNIIALRGNAANPELQIVDGGAPQVQLDAGTIVANTPYSLTGWWQTNDCKARQNSGATVSDYTATIPTVTQARLGSDGTNYLNGHLANISYYDTFSGQIYTRRKNKAVFSLL